MPASAQSPTSIYTRGCGSIFGGCDPQIGWQSAGSGGAAWNSFAALVVATCRNRTPIPAAEARPATPPAAGAPLTDLHRKAIFMQMRTTLILDEALLEKARQLSGLTGKTAVLHAGLEAL